MDGTIAWSRSADLRGSMFPATNVGRAERGVDCPLRFPGRYRSPHRSRPLGLAPTMNPRGYVDNPLVWHDVLGLAGGDTEWVDPKDLCFSQYTISGNTYAETMKAGEWDWNQPGAELRVLEMNGHLVSNDNRRLDAALEAGQERVPISRLNATDAELASTTGRTWEQSFRRGFSSPRNRAARARVPDGGTQDWPIVDCP